MKLDVHRHPLHRDHGLGCILFLGLMKTYNPEVYGYLFGSVLSVTKGLLTIGGLSIAVLGTILLLQRTLLHRHSIRNGGGVWRPARQIFSS